MSAYLRDLIDISRLPTSHELRFNGRETQAVDDLRRKERQGSQRYAVEDVRQVMRHHPGTKHGFHDLLSRGMLVRVSSALDLNARLDELLVVFGQKLRSRWVIGEVEECQEGTKYGDQAFDDELELDERISHFRATKYCDEVLDRGCPLTNHRKPSSPALPLICPTLIDQGQQSCWAITGFPDPYP